MSSYPDLKSSQAEAEEAASKKALDKLPLLVKKKEVSQLPTTTDYDVSITRVRQVSGGILFQSQQYCGIET